MMEVDQNLFDRAVDQMTLRWPDASEAVVAAAYLDDGSVLTGVSLPMAPRLTSQLNRGWIAE